MREIEIYSFCYGFMSCLFLIGYAVLTKDFRRNRGVPKARYKTPPPKKMRDKNGIEIKVGDRILSKGKFEYEIRLISEQKIIETWKENGPFLIARGKNLHHTGRLENLDLSQIVVLR